MNSTKFVARMLIPAFVLASTARAGDATYPFVPQTQAGGAPLWACALGDVDHDGDLDAAVTFESGIVALFPGTGDGSFATPISIANSPIPRCIALADLDGDGSLDLVFGDFEQSHLRFFRGNGDGTFTAGPVQAGVGSPWKLLVGDVDGDTDLDLVMVDFHGSSVRVFSNQGSLNFLSSAVLPLPGSGTSAALGDFDGDQDFDLFATTYTGTIVQWRNNGAGVFTTVTTYPGNNQLADVIVGRFNADAFLDVATIASDTGMLSIRRGNSSGLFLIPDSVSLGGGLRSLTSADVDRDGDLDLVFSKDGTSTPGGIGVAFNAGTATFPRVDSYPFGRSLSVVTARLDADADVDLVFALNNGLVSLSNHGDGTFPSIGLSSLGVTGSSLAQLASADLEGDGDQDLLVVANASSGPAHMGQLYLGRNDGTGAFQWSLVGTSPGLHRQLVLADLDGDGDIDLAHLIEGSTIVLWFNDGSANFTMTTIAVASQSFNLLVGDVDGDGDNDLAVLNSNDGVTPAACRILLNSGTGIFSTGPVLLTNETILAAALADVNSDGRADVVLAAYSTSSIRIALANEQGGFDSFVAHPSGLYVNTLAIGDVDADGDPDLVWGRDESQASMGWLRNEGSGSFTSMPTFGQFRVFGALALLDFDSDGDLDLAPYQNGAAVALFENDGLGSFSHQVEYSVAGMRAIAVDDWNGDGRIDFAVGCDSAGSPLVAPLHVNLFLNQGPNPRFVPFCFGDGSGTACPCGNASTPGSGAGCVHSFGYAARLEATGSASVSSDSVVLAGTDLPDRKSALFAEGSQQDDEALGIALGDGLRCITGSIVRMGMRTTDGGNASYGGPLGDIPISERGHVPAAGRTLYYQVFYRNSVAYCTPATFNLTNGVAIVWTP